MVELSSVERLALTQSSCALVQYDAWNGTVAAFEAALGEKIGGPVPARVGDIALYGDLKVIRVSPCRFWVFSREDRSTIAADIPQELGCRLDLGEGRMRIRIVSAKLSEILSRCLAVDWETTLNTASFTSLHRVPVMFSRVSDNEGEFVVPRSFAGSIADWLETCG